jgi:predicted RNA-binding protein (TIGR00451 family)
LSNQRTLVNGELRLNEALKRIRAIADYQFGKDVGAKLFPESARILFSKRTGRIRYVYLDDKHLATLRPTDGFFSLGINGAKRLAERAPKAVCFVTVRKEVAQFIVGGGDVFAAHVLKADTEIRAKDEVIILDNDGHLLAVGRATLCGEEMMAFKRGVAVKVRRGASEES